MLHKRKLGDRPDGGANRCLRRFVRLRRETEEEHVAGIRKENREKASKISEAKQAERVLGARSASSRRTREEGGLGQGGTAIYA